MAKGNINPLYKLNNWDGDFDVPEGHNVILHQLFLNDSDAILFVELNAFIWFI